VLLFFPYLFIYLFTNIFFFFFFFLFSVTSMSELPDNDPHAFTSSRASSSASASAVLADIESKGIDARPRKLLAIEFEDLEYVDACFSQARLELCAGCDGEAKEWTWQ
jgi:hypothetical protein